MRVYGRENLYARLGDRHVCTIEYGRIAEFEGDKLWKPNFFIREALPGGFGSRIHERRRNGGFYDLMIMISSIHESKMTNV